MEALVIAKKDKVKGLFVFCMKCKTVIESGKCGQTEKRLSSCGYTEQHAFRAIVAVPGTNGSKRKSRVFKTRDVHEAIKLKLQFETELEATGYQTSTTHISLVDSKPLLLIECMAMYIGFLNNEGVDAHKIKERSKGHINEVKRYFEYFCLCLKTNGLDHTTFQIEQVNDRVVALIHDYALKQLKFKNKTYNKLVATYRQFINWLIEKRNYNIRNPFIDVTRRKEIVKVVTAQKSDFEELLRVITPENGEMFFSTGEKRDMYRPWLKHSFKLALATGGRREEFMTLKFSDIVVDENGIPSGITQENFKVNRIMGLSKSDEGKQVKFIPMTQELIDLLIELDFEKYKGSDNYLIAPDSLVTRKTMIDFVSKAYSHYWKKTGIDKPLQLKNLRKTFMTSLVDHFGDKANLVSDHEGMEVVKKYYLNKRQLTNGLEAFSVFK
jgi:integrase